MRWEDDDIKTEYMSTESGRSIPVEDTVVFDLNCKPQGASVGGARYMLLRKRSGERIVLNVPSTIGRGFKADTKIRGNLAISRAHARVQMANGKLVITDLDSVNGTRVRGERIPPHAPVEVCIGDDICFASEAFRLLMEG